MAGASSVSIAKAHRCPKKQSSNTFSACAGSSSLIESGGTRRGRDIDKLRHDNMFTDMSIISDNGVEFRAHKSIICAQSEFFYKAMSSGMEESETGIVKLREDETFVVKEMISYAYSARYKVPDTYKDSERLFHAKMYCFADKIMMASLRDTALGYFEQCGSVPRSKEWAEIVNYVYESSTHDSPLRQMLAKEIMAQPKAIIWLSIANGYLERILRSNSDFGRDLMVSALADGMVREKGEGSVILMQGF